MNLISTLSKIVHCFLIKIVHCFLYKLFLAFCIKLFVIQHYLKNCSLSFLRNLFFVHYLKNHSLFSHKTPNEIVFLNLNSKSECFFMFEFHNNWIYFSALIKSVSTLINLHYAHHVYCIFESAYCIHKICFFTLSKTVHYFLITIVHCFLHKLFLTICIQLFYV